MAIFWQFYLVIMHWVYCYWWLAILWSEVFCYDTTAQTTILSIREMGVTMQVWPDIKIIYAILISIIYRSIVPLVHCSIKTTYLVSVLKTKKNREERRANIEFPNCFSLSPINALVRYIKADAYTHLSIILL